MTIEFSATLRTWLTEPLSADVAASVERIRRATDVCHVALMPDVHLASDVCVGAVVATSELIYPSAVGGDIGCGMAAVAFDVEGDLLRNERTAAQLLADLYQQVPSNKHRSRHSWPSALRDESLSHSRLQKAAERDGRVQLGTLGRGNHFLEFQSDSQQQLWVLVHSGSRAMGQLITRHHVERCDWANSTLPSLVAASDAGQSYLNDVRWARVYAAENRLAMLQAVAQWMHERFAVAVDWNLLIHTDHNHVEREQHFGRDLWVHRKGAQSARDAAPAIIPGSMGTPSNHVVGRGEPESLRSCSHGAGRRMSRTEAARQISVQALSRQMHGIWFDQRRSRSLCDEAPTAYRDIHRVMNAQRDLVAITRQLRPLLSYKGI
jgi:tRNA-splicing ligase RtcB